MPENFGNAPVGGTVMPCPGDQPPTHWLEIELVDEDGQPVANEEFKVVLPDGQVVSGFLDAQGRERIDPVSDAGQCQVSFPGIDGREWGAQG